MKSVNVARRHVAKFFHLTVSVVVKFFHLTVSVVVKLLPVAVNVPQ